MRTFAFSKFKYISLIAVLLTIPSSSGDVFLRLQAQPRTYSEALLDNLNKTVDIDQFREILKPILVERVVGTSGHERVKKYIINELEKLGWFVELDSFDDMTPDMRQLSFTNIIGTHKTNVSQFLVLSCHYDSKLSDFVFIGATDSAVPCAMLLYLIKNLDNTLRKLQSRVGLQVIFFDGEEAFVEWTATDSLYGSRHLAAVLASKPFDASKNITYINRISLFVLLDLLGASSPEFCSYFSNTNKWYLLLAAIEKRLLGKGFLQPDLEDGVYRPYFRDLVPQISAVIQDDHIPFLQRGVPILHLISDPYPTVWHKESDNETAINFKTVNNLLKIFKLFIVHYLERFI